MGVHRTGNRVFIPVDRPSVAVSGADTEEQGKSGAKIRRTAAERPERPEQRKRPASRKPVARSLDPAPTSHRVWVMGTAIRSGADQPRRLEDAGLGRPFPLVGDRSSLGSFSLASIARAITRATKSGGAFTSGAPWRSCTRILRACSNAARASALSRRRASARTRRTAGHQSRRSP